MSRRAWVATMAALAALVALSAVVAPVHATDLGRLFLTPAERAALDRARLGADVPEPTPPVEAPAPLDLVVDEVIEDLEPVRVDGFVRRSGGPATVWVNGTDSYQGNLGEHGLDADDLRVDEARVRLPVPATGEVVSLKPGQAWDPNARRVTEPYERADPPVEPFEP